MLVSLLFYTQNTFCSTFPVDYVLSTVIIMHRSVVVVVVVIYFHCLSFASDIFHSWHFVFQSLLSVETRRTNRLKWVNWIAVVTNISHWWVHEIVVNRFLSVELQFKVYASRVVASAADFCLTQMHTNTFVFELNSWSYDARARCSHENVVLELAKTCYQKWIELIFRMQTLRRAGQ